MIFSLSCCTVPEMPTVERCTTVIEFDKCRCHLYDINRLERISSAYDKSMDYCDNLTGFHAEDWAKEITPKGKYMIKWAKQHCGKEESN